QRFFDPENHYSNHDERVNHFELDGFRPLVNFLEGKTRNPDERVVKILAWLIDFEPRPYAEWKKLEQRATNDRPNTEVPPPDKLPLDRGSKIVPAPQGVNVNRSN